MTPLVSVIIPAYNAERYIERALRSALEQTYQNLEIIIVDDGSQDETARIVQDLADSRVVYMHQGNAGQGNARNNALRGCRGDYVSFLDADDFYHPRKIERQLEYLKAHARYKIVYCNALHVYADAPDRFYRKKGHYRSGQILPELLRSSYINPNTVLASREVFERCGGFVETRYYPEEWDLWLRIALAGFEFGYLDEDLVTVEIREESNTTMTIQPILKTNAISMFETLLPRGVEVGGTLCTKDRAVRRLRFKLAVAYLANGRRRESLATLASSLGPRSIAYVVVGALMMMPRVLVRKLWLANQRRNSVVVKLAGCEKSSTAS